MRSARIGDADVEGKTEEMIAIANAIKAKQSVHFKRCAAIRTSDGYQIYSPRNSQEMPIISFEEADALADDILNKCQTKEQAHAQD